MGEVYELKKGLKKGDVFEDGGRMFRVTGVLKNGNYLSEALPEENSIGMDAADTVVVEDDEAEAAAKAAEEKAAKAAAAKAEKAAKAAEEKAAKAAAEAKTAE